MRRLDDEARRLAGAIDEATGGTVRDCVVEADRAIVLIAPEDMAQVIGEGGGRIRDLEERVGRDLKLVADAPTPEGLIGNALEPAAVGAVTIEDREDERVAVAQVDPADRGVAIGRDGRNVAAAETLAARHTDVDRVEIDTA
ncbi:NusA-like transcription termination signal-binding factor [Halococcoides cellulosivorans]|nr:NusA-like transcription termination signal-binding factor [Halococcoides cellulosivorans]